MANQQKKVVVGLSGGVDSSVSALLLQKEGFEVIAAHMIVHPQGFETQKEAQAIAEILHIPFYSFDLTDAFEAQVSIYLKEEYLAGRTPNPCVVCNGKIKFGLFLQEIEKEIGHFDFFATGHYAKIKKLPNGCLTIAKGSDNEKDQAYFLSRLNQNQIAKILFPLHGLKKKEVRSIAEAHHLPCAASKESQDLCTGSYLQYIPKGSGEGIFIEESSGKKVGIHKGIENYTIGQRRGLNIGIGYPLYVSRIDPQSNIVYVDQEEKLLFKKMLISNINWISIKEPKPLWKGEIKIRYRDKGARATLIEIIKEKNQDWAIIEFETPARAITPGQLAVAYEDEALVFSGYIEKALKN